MVLGSCVEGLPPDHSIHTLLGCNLQKCVRKDVKKSADLKLFGMNTLMEITLPSSVWHRTTLTELSRLSEATPLLQTLFVRQC